VCFPGVGVYTIAVLLRQDGVEKLVRTYRLELTQADHGTGAPPSDKGTPLSHMTQL
jgi:hypothetical protein